MEIDIKKVMSLDLYKILDIEEDASDNDVSNVCIWRFENWRLSVSSARCYLPWKFTENKYYYLLLFSTVLSDYAGNSTKLATAVACSVGLCNWPHHTGKRPWVFS